MKKLNQNIKKDAHYEAGNLETRNREIIRLALWSIVPILLGIIVLFSSFKETEDRINNSEFWALQDSLESLSPTIEQIKTLEAELEKFTPLKEDYLELIERMTTQGTNLVRIESRGLKLKNRFEKFEFISPIINSQWQDLTDNFNTLLKLSTDNHKRKHDSKEANDYEEQIAEQSEKIHTLRKQIYDYQKKEMKDELAFNEKVSENLSLKATISELERVSKGNDDELDTYKTELQAIFEDEKAKILENSKKAEISLLHEINGRLQYILIKREMLKSVVPDIRTLLSEYQNRKLKLEAELKSKE